MLNKLVKTDGDFRQLKQWEKRSYKAYCIDKIADKILKSEPIPWKEITKEHILKTNVFELGASCIDIYLVAYVAESYGAGKDRFFQYIYDNEISDKPSTAQGIWQVGKGDGVYLGVLNDDGTVRDWDFFIRWTRNY